MAKRNWKLLKCTGSGTASRRFYIKMSHEMMRCRCKMKKSKKWICPNQEGQPTWVWDFWVWDWVMYAE